VRAELSEAVNTVERLNSDMNQLKLAHSLKLAGMARRIDEDVHFLMQERDQLQVLRHKRPACPQKSPVPTKEPCIAQHDEPTNTRPSPLQVTKHIVCWNS
jgi:hypothetical protein